MRRGHTKQRLFVAVYPPPEVTAWMADLVSALPLPPHRLVPVEQVHLTVHFIGTVSSRDLPTIEEGVERSVAGLPPFELTTSRMISLPEQSNRPSRVVAVETSNSVTLQEIKTRLVQRSARPSRRDPLDRFVPHLTMLRLTPPTVDLSLCQTLEHRSFDIQKVQLMRSELKPSGAEHRQVSDFLLTGP